MKKESFDLGWMVAPKLSAFEAIAGGGAPEAVRLLHDGMRDLVRDPDAANGGHTGYHPGAHLSYIKKFDAPEGWGEKVVEREFEGVYRDAVVYVNGDFAAQRPNGYSTFRVALAPYLRYGASNTVRVEAKSHEDSRWYSGTGIHRSTWLSVSDPVHVVAGGVRVTTPVVDDDLSTVSADVTVVNESRRTRTVRIRTEVRGPDDTVIDHARATAPLTVLPGGTATVRLRHFLRRPQLWDVDSPALYTLRTRIADGDGDGLLDEDHTTFGIRSLSVDPMRGLRINGRSVTLHGGCVHHDNGPLCSVAIARAEERRVEILLAAGYNAVRSSHNPLSVPFIEACDRLGMLVIDELSDVWSEGKTSFDYSAAFPEWWIRGSPRTAARSTSRVSGARSHIGARRSGACVTRPTSPCTDRRTTAAR